MHKRFWFLGLLLPAVALMVSSCALLEHYKQLLRPPTAATPTAAVTITQGQVRDAITSLPVAGAQLQAGTVMALSDVEGAFSVPSLGVDVISVTAPGYEAAQVRPRAGFPLVVDLVPDASTTFKLIYGYEKRHEFGPEYDLLHPDVQALFSRDEFIRYMEQNRPYDLVDFSVGAADMLTSGMVLGRVYTNVAQVRVQATVRVGGQLAQRVWLGYAAKVDGLWRWFRGPLASPTPTPTMSTTQGHIRDAITKLPVAGAQLQAGTVMALSDVEGAFSIPFLGEDVINVTAPGYEAAQVRPRAGFPLVVDLVPDASTTFKLIYGYEKRHEFGPEYDLLHPDVQALFSRDEFIRYMEQNRPYDLVDFSVGAADMLTSGMVLGKVYTNVAQVRVQATVRVGGQLAQRVWLGYAAKADGLWRWFRGPLAWPTPFPTATSTPLPTAMPTPLPTATSTPLPTSTLLPIVIASPTPYAPIPPGSQAVVIVDAVNLHTGPGAHYPVAWSVIRGTVVLILDWPRWAEGWPWYQVQIVGQDRNGWCNGTYLALLVITETPTREPTTPVPPAVQPIAFTSDRDGNQEIYVMNPDGTGLRNLTQHPAQDADATWAPMYDRLAFVSNRNGNNDIFLINADGSGLTQLTSSTADQIHPAWSPDGALIAYVSNEDGDWEIFVMSANGTGVIQLTHNDAWDSYPSWSPDSRKLVFTSERDGNYELYLYDLETQAETRLTDNPASDAFPAWSPVGEEIAFTSARDGQLELYLLDLTATPQRITRLTYTVAAGAANRYPAWSSDGYWLAFTSWRDGNAEIYVIGRDGWGLRNLTNHPAADESPAWAD